MLEISTQLLPIAPVQGLPVLLGAGALTAPDGFAQAFADAAAGTIPAPTRQEFAAPGKTAFAALPVSSDPGAALLAGFAPEDHALPAEVRLSPGDAKREDSSESAPLGDPQPGALPVVALTFPVPPADAAAATAPRTAYALGAVGDELPLLNLARGDAVATAVPLSPAASDPAVPLTDQTLQSLARSAVPVPEHLAANAASVPAPSKAAVSSAPAPALRLDRSVQVLAGGASPLRTGAFGSAVERVVRDFAAADGAAAVPLAPQSVTDGAALAPRLAAQIFAAALAAPTRQSDPVLGDVAGGDEVISAADTALASAAPAIADQRPAVTAPRPLDTTREDWPQRLIDRVEAARDAANAADTRIRLVPEALGKIDIALRQEGSTLHVHFTAEQAATRDLLNDAQPRLAELAAARGLQLGEAGVGAGAREGGGQRTPVASAVRANAPASDSGAKADIGSGDRIA